MSEPENKITIVTSIPIGVDENGKPVFKAIEDSYEIVSIDEQTGMALIRAKEREGFDGIFKKGVAVGVTYSTRYQPDERDVQDER